DHEGNSIDGHYLEIAVMQLAQCMDAAHYDGAYQVPEHCKSNKAETHPDPVQRVMRDVEVKRVKCKDVGQRDRLQELLAKAETQQRILLQGRTEVELFIYAILVGCQITYIGTIRDHH